MKSLVLGILVVFSMSAFSGETKIRVAYAAQDFGNWHFCGTQKEHKPFCEAGDEVKGFNAEVTRELFNRLGKNFEVVFEKWNSNEFLNGLNAGRYDMIISNVGYKESRKKYGIYSSQPYESLNALPDYHFFAKKSDQMTLQKIGVAQDSLLHAFLNTIFKPEAIVPLSGPESLIDALLNDKVNVIFASFSGNREWICANPEIVKLSTIPTSLNVAGINDDTYIMTTKRYPELAKEVDVALASMHRDGTVDRLFEKWIKEKPSCEGARP